MQIRKIIIFVILGIAILTFGAASGYCADTAKIGTVNFEKIFNNSAGGKAVKDRLNEESRGMNAELDKIGNEIKELQEMLSKDESAGVMNKDAREDKAWERDRKIDEAKALKKRYDRKISEMQAKLINGVRRDLLKIISEYGKKEGYLLIIEDINAVYSSPSIDITDKVIQLYDTEYSKKSK